jgi:hypothetical protein
MGPPRRQRPVSQPSCTTQLGHRVRRMARAASDQDHPGKPGVPVTVAVRVVVLRQPPLVELERQRGHGDQDHEGRDGKDEDVGGEHDREHGRTEPRISRRRRRELRERPTAWRGRTRDRAENDLPRARWNRPHRCQRPTPEPATRRRQVRRPLATKLSCRVVTACSTFAMPAAHPSAMSSLSNPWPSSATKPPTSANSHFSRHQSVEMTLSSLTLRARTASAAVTAVRPR